MDNKERPIFKEYLKNERVKFAKVVSKYTVDEHLKLRVAVDDFLIAFDNAVKELK